MKKIKLIIIAVIALAALAGIGWHIYGRIQASRPLPSFYFDGSTVKDWVGSDNVNVQAVARSTDYTGEEPIERLPIADLTVHHRTGNNTADDNCFLMYSYYDRVLDDVAHEYTDYIDRKTSGDTKHSLEAHESTNQTITTFEGDKAYELKRYRYTVESEGALEGYQIGFVPLSSGYIRVEGVCKTVEDLERTLPALTLVHLDDR